MWQANDKASAKTFYTIVAFALSVYKRKQHIQSKANTYNFFVVQKEIKKRRQ